MEEMRGHLRSELGMAEKEPAPFNNKPGEMVVNKDESKSDNSHIMEKMFVVREKSFDLALDKSNDLNASQRSAKKYEPKQVASVKSVRSVKNVDNSEVNQIGIEDD